MSFFIFKIKMMKKVYFLFNVVLQCCLLYALFNGYLNGLLLSVVCLSTFMSLHVFCVFNNYCYSCDFFFPIYIFTAVLNH